MNIVYAASAQKDLESLVSFIAEDSPQNAAMVLDRIEEQIKLLATQPQMGRPGRVPQTRELVVANTPFIIPYQVKGGVLIILRVYHSSRRWPETF